MFMETVTSMDYVVYELAYPIAIFMQRVCSLMTSRVLFYKTRCWLLNGNAASPLLEQARVLLALHCIRRRFNHQILSDRI